MQGLIGLVSILVLGIISFSSAYGETQGTQSEQTSLSGDLEKNPMAQDILRKIEQTKKWIAELELRNYEKSQAQIELEQKRLVALNQLSADLEKWEDLWANYTSRAAYTRFVDKQPGFIQGVFWDQFEFTQSKVDAGRAALKQVLANGGSLAEGREAFIKAAETTRIELIEANAQINIEHNLAYYEQQILFDIEGKFVRTHETVEKLNQYYTDFRADPEYIAANPDDIKSLEALGGQNSNTECREGYANVHRYNANDYVCVTESTAEMWIRHGMGEITGAQTSFLEDNENDTNPMTLCGFGYQVVLVLSTGEYSCVSTETAEDWILEGLAEKPDVEAYIFEKINQRKSKTTIYEINEKIWNLHADYEVKLDDITEEYDRIYKIKEVEAVKAEKKVAEKFYENRYTMTKEEFSSEISKVRDSYKDSFEDILDAKLHALDYIKSEYDSQVHGLENQYDGFDIVWNSKKRNYEAVTS